VIEERVMNLGDNENLRRGFLDIFRALAVECEMDEQSGINVPTRSLNMPMYKDGDLQPGDWAADLFFVIRKVEYEEAEKR